MRFEWDEDKARTNLAKHGVPFEYAQIALEDPLQYVTFDDRDYDEERWLAVTCLPWGTMLAIAFTEREGDDGQPVTRIISVRHATGVERARYRAASQNLRGRRRHERRD